MIRLGLGLAMAGAAALTLAACGRADIRRDDGGDGPMKAVARLDCPDAQGGLTRKAAAADGRSCDYAGADGAVIALTLNPMNGRDADAVLDPMGRDLRAELPTTPASRAADAGAQTGKNGDEKVDIDLPGVHIHANGDRASVDAGPPDGKGGVRVNANDNGAEVRVEDKSGSGVRKLLILTADKPGPHGYTVAGYDARGPAGGPLVVAAVRARDHNHDALMHDVSQLVARNTKG